MSQQKAKHIQVLGDYNKKSPTQNLLYASAVHAGVYSDPVDYPAPPIDEATFKAAIDALSVKITAALDGGKMAIAERDQQEQLVVQMMRQLGHYVEIACKDDPTTFLKSGFQAKSIATGPKPTLTQFIRSVKPGENSGTMEVILVAVDGAGAYQLRWAPIVNGT